ncbi:spore germination protein [Pseudalkalibacillus salsuginis]|uniref:spore germination protein n=1 Tax=Pseudalkalibacillus salsuginis TaxID=2910972 RepID=UPI001F3DDEE9|nr:spore germination protein [Pseudalkalibacillus salsuginis]MCF6409811.1 spore germination protein [Pseudalkalibacillus salsuginis]
MRRIKKSLKNRRSQSLPTQNDEIKNKEHLTGNLKENIQKVKEETGNSDDIIVREIRTGKERKLNAALIYTDGLIDNRSIQDFILESLMFDIQDIETDKKPSSKENQLQQLKDSVLAVGDLKDITDYNTLFTSLLSGHVILLLDGYTQGFAIGMKGGKVRGVSEATTESTVRGPKEAYSESLRTNTSLLRRKVNDRNLWLETKKIGTVTKTDVSIAYIKNIANDKVVEEVRQRLDRIEIDGILETGYIEELIQDETYTPFPTIFTTERPDVTAANLLEGRIAIFVDGAPHCLIVPALFVQFFQTADDYYQRADIVTLLRILRFIGFFIALLGPSLYIAITTFHQEMLPTPLLINLAAQREGVPFPAFIEALLMEVTFEILREAGVRMPRTIGQAVSIVGTLVIGTAAVDAGIVSAAMVIVVAITAISSFIVSSFNLSISVRMLRFVFMGLAASFGLFGISIGLLALTLHLCSLRSFGVPYMSPLAPFNMEGQKDVLIRFPRWALFSRPRLINQKNLKREDVSSPKPESQKRK